ncbi:acyltransferase family protein [Jiella avicenniae]|uniref:Acyltransferase n=1 Tax=Jiella avicenniae TaxID=2907202 RepID=A0A9X1P4P7_9HYPH|nr:acyltransferase [Jiella avicenniae]MCE7030215.1 acyltransferase [Jiella avicenniae]
MYYRIFDCWRLVAAMLIMAYHFLFWAPYGVETGTHLLHRLMPLLDMFFMISGFFITTRYRDKIGDFASYGRFMRGRAARLLPLHYVITLFFAAIALYAWAKGAPHYPWRHNLEALPAHLLLLHAFGVTDGLALNYPSWSISAEFFAYALFPLIVLLLRVGGLKALLVAIAAWVGLLEYASANGWFGPGGWTTADAMGAYRALADFMIGAAVAIVVERRMIDVRSHLPGCLATALVVTAMLSGLDHAVVMPLIVSALVLTALAETARPESTAFLAPLMPVTRVAFGIYLIHPVMEFIFLEVVWYHGLAGTGLIGFYLYWWLPMIASVAAAMLSHRYFEPFCARGLLPPRPSRRKAERMLASA